MYLWTIILLTFASFGCVLGATSIPSTSVSPQPAYQPQGSANGYGPLNNFPPPDTYGSISPYGYSYHSSFNSEPAASFTSSLIPTAQGALQVFYRLGLFLMGGVVFLLMGAVFTTVICNLTPICTITFPGWDEFNKNTMRSFMTPEKISTAAALVQDAIGKYQRLQRTVNND